MSRRAAVVALSLLTLVSGCRTPPKDDAAVRYNPGTEPTTIEVGSAGTYRLRASTPEGEPECVEVELPKGAVLGFRRKPDGTLVAVADSQTIPMMDAVSLWRAAAKPTVPERSRFADNAHDRCKKAAQTLTGIICFPAALALMILTGGAIAEL